MSPKIGRTQRVIIGVLAANGGAVNSYSIQRLAGSYNGWWRWIRPALMRLYERGLVKKWPGCSLTEAQKRAIEKCKVQHPRASVFWVLNLD